MPLIKNGEIQQLIKLFTQRGMSLYHACQFKDFKTYIRLGGVPSRNLMEKNNLPFTKFDTDDTDKNNDVWTKVFANLSDFGINFARFGGEDFKVVPNPYGPIQLVLKPECLTETTDVAVCFRSAGSIGFNRENESLGSCEDIDRIFKHKIDEAPNDWAKTYIKYSPELAKEFDLEKASSPELSFTIADELIPFNFLSEIIIDPYFIGGNGLVKEVGTIINEQDFKVSVKKRSYSPNIRFNIFRELNDLFQNGISDLETIMNRPETSDELKAWLTRVVENKTDYNFIRYAKYLIEGTISELEKK